MKEMLRNLAYAKRLVKEGSVKRVSQETKMGIRWKVKEHLVRYFTKKGRNLMGCDCDNDTLFVKESPLCVHKVAVLLFETDRNFIEHVDKMIKDYKSYKDNMKPNWEMMIHDLETLKWIK